MTQRKIDFCFKSVNLFEIENTYYTILFEKTHFISCVLNGSRHIALLDICLLYTFMFVYFEICSCDGTKQRKSAVTFFGNVARISQ